MKTGKWNYRVVRKHYANTDEVSYDVYRVYYADQDAKVVNGIDADPASPSGETFEELKADVQRIADAMGRHTGASLYKILDMDQNGKLIKTKNT